MSISKNKNKTNWYEKKRNKRKLIAPERHLILCEGTKTEPNYFNEIKRRINDNYKERINIEIMPSGKGRLKLLEQAKDIVKKSLQDYKHIWLVYDKDDFNDDDFDNTVYKINEINKDSEIKYHALWSNQCIEVWFLLHFIDLKVDLSRKDYIKKINSSFKNNNIDNEYKKNDPEIYKKLEKFQDQAIIRAKKIMKENKGKNPSKIAPGSMIYEIIDMLKVYLKKYT